MDYSPNENAADKKIGYLAGYKVAKASEEDGPLMIRLAPKMKCVSREWHFRAENEKEFKKWKKAFKIACSKVHIIFLASNSLTRDNVPLSLGRAFKR
jgi:hypothetical protein